jgi:aminoglycoside 2''-phosphotransferase
VRFPLVAEAPATLATELALLPQLTPHLPVAVPSPEHVAQHDDQLVFAAYRALEGEPVSDAALSALEPAARALDELAALLDAIHRFPVDRAQAAGVSFELCKDGYHAGQANLEHELDGMLDASELAAIAGQRAAFEEAQPHPSTPVLLHADIKPDHLLHNPKTGALTGLLDWGDASLGSADFDLAIIRTFCGPDTLQGLLDRLPRANAERASASIPFLLSLRRLQDAVFARDRLRPAPARRSRPRRC